jgi:hypothetical protein
MELVKACIYIGIAACACGIVWQVTMLCVEEAWLPESVTIRWSV